MVSAHLRKCIEIIETVTHGADAGASVRKDPSRWSVAEIVEHLARAYSGTAKGFERCLEKGAPLATVTSLKQTLSQVALINFGLFPQGRQAPKHIIPTGELDLNAVIDAARKNLGWLDDAAIKTKQALGPGKMLDHPILGALTVDQWLRFHVVHTEHHARQIRERR
jgi:hypothetical protein